MFDLKRPCENCPFRTDCLDGWLRRARAQGIIDGLLFGESFPCHKTVDYAAYDEDDLDEEEAVGITPKTQHCAGAAILLSKLDRPNAAMQIGERLGWRDPAALDMDAPVFDQLEQFVEHHTQPGER